MVTHAAFMRNVSPALRTQGWRVNIGYSLGKGPTLSEKQILSYSYHVEEHTALLRYEHFVKTAVLRRMHWKATSYTCHKLKLPFKNDITIAADLHNGLCVIQVVLESILGVFLFLFGLVSSESVLHNEMKFNFDERSVGYCNCTRKFIVHFQKTPYNEENVEEVIEKIISERVL